MIPAEHRHKGGALLLGAERPGQPGPFGTWTEDEDQRQDDQQQQEDDLRC